MNKDFVPYEQALALKELGFDEPCLGFYNYQGQLILMTQEDENSIQVYKNSYVKLGKQYAVPLYQQAFRWFRQKYKLHNGIYPYYDEYEFQIKDFRLPTNIPINGGLMNYEEAEIACLKKLIEIIKTK